MSSYKRSRYSSSMEELIKQGKLPTGHLLAFEEDGDVCIQIENYKILVSSEKLSSGSPVFAAMLNGGFREGMKTPMGDQQVHQLSLPDDDIDLVILFCKVLYDRQDTIEKPPGGLCWLRLAEFCDKYQCVPALKTNLEGWMEKSIYYRRSDNIQDHCSLLLAAYIFDSGDTFNKVSERILKIFRERGWKKNERLSWYLLMDHYLVDADLAKAFESKHKFFKKEIENIFTKPFEILKDCTCQNNPNVRARKAASLFERLFNADLMPEDIRKVSVRDIVQRVNNLQEVHCGHYKSCCVYSTKLKESLQQEMRWIEASGIGLCLNCLKRFQNGHCPSHPPAKIPISRYF
ncbi:hypothetical protein DPV78_010944 [Talaromyces pinophilus]|nr:hypothetical protein DPV78_010944 [Talaromyces pinophilus]